jgi:hypothetical protein
MKSDDDLIVEALKIDWDHARHVETQRLRLVTVYIIAVLGAGLAAMKSDMPWIQGLASIVGLLISAFCWAMTHKWNAEFVNQIKSAELCARRLKVTSLASPEETEELFSYIGFPKPDPFLPKVINVRRMFNWFYAVFIVVWLIISVNVLLPKTPTADNQHNASPNKSLQSNSVERGH